MSTAAQVTYDDVARQRVSSRGERLRYGAESIQQFGVLRVPARPAAIAVLVHGGCWLAEYDYRHLERMAEVLTERGLATWSIEYRRLGDDGGGWPGTFRDVARGLDHLRVVAVERGVDLGRVIVVGHSAGAQLALWLAARAKLEERSDLFVADPLPISGVVALAPITDLASYALGRGSCNASVPKLLGAGARDVAARCREASPLELVPIASPIRLVHGALDSIVPLEQSRRFFEAQRAACANVELDVDASAGHFDLIAPFAPAWTTVERRISELAALDAGGAGTAARR